MTGLAQAPILTKHLGKSIFLASCFLSLVFSSSSAQDKYGKGYSILNDVEITNADLTQTVNMRVNVQTIRQGLILILSDTGWRLADEIYSDPKLHQLLSSPWPASWQRIGPDQLGNVLNTIGGQGWQLVTDPINRLISYEVNTRLMKPKKINNNNGVQK
ncbi:hypothetical protein AwWohl_01270 [Gammaproteobacteria bacterium]|nr:hypothetical protein AwWohl_01270 [Gammaproteobacteria bacterium]